MSTRETASLNDPDSYDLWGGKDGSIFVTLPRERCSLCEEWAPAYETETSTEPEQRRAS